MKPIKYHIRPLQTIKEYHNCEEIQKQVWQFEDREIIPKNELITIQRNGGVVLGAFSPSGKMLGFVFGLPGIYQGKLIHCSRMVAVLPAYRNSDIGYKLKLAQRDFVLKQNISLITWTFDPLQSLNAYFNIRKLGVIVRTYYVNLYGSSTSILNQGLATDRFLAEWWIRRKPRIINYLSLPATAKVVNPTHFNKHGWLVCEQPKLNLKVPKLLVEIPSDIMGLKKASLNLARDWRLKTRAIFTTYFRRGYIVTGYITQNVKENRRSFYLLTKRK